MDPKDLRALGRGNEGNGEGSCLPRLSRFTTRYPSDEALARGADEERDPQTMQQAEIGEKGKRMLHGLAEADPRVGGNAGALCRRE